KTTDTTAAPTALPLHFFSPAADRSPGTATTGRSVSALNGGQQGYFALSSSQVGAGLLSAVESGISRDRTFRGKPSRSSGSADRLPQVAKIALVNLGPTGARNVPQFVR